MRASCTHCLEGDRRVQRIQEDPERPQVETVVGSVDASTTGLQNSGMQDHHAMAVNSTQKHGNNGVSSRRYEDMQSWGATWLLLAPMTTTRGSLPTTVAASAKVC